MLTKRIIPCLDIKNGRTVKGIHFEDLRDAGDPVELAVHYALQGADELVFLDISATEEKRKTLITLVERIAQQIRIPFTVGGGVASVEDVAMLLDSGADKVSLNTAAVLDPGLITSIAKRFGSQCVVLAIDAKKIDGVWNVQVNGGKKNTGREVIAWAKEAADRGAGEILLTSMSNDGAKNGFETALTRELSRSLPIPVIASGGAGTMEHFRDVFTQGEADAALAASVFHYKEMEIPGLKYYLQTNKIPVRL